MSNCENCITFSESFKIRFKGDNSIEIQQLFGCILGIEEAYKACLCAQYHAPSATLHAVAVKEGSFEIELQSVVALAPDIITYIPPALTCFKTLLEIVKIKRELKGKKPLQVEQKGATAQITNCDGDVHYHDCKVTNMYFNNCRIDAGLARAFTATSVGKPKESLQISSGDESVEIIEGDYPIMATAIIEPEEKYLRKMVNTVQEELLIKKADLIGNSKWDFICGNKTIAAAIEDNAFLERVHSGKVTFASGAKLLVQLRIEADFDEYLSPRNHKYYVEKIRGDVIPPALNEQLKMNFE